MPYATIFASFSLSLFVQAGQKTDKSNQRTHSRERRQYGSTACRMVLGNVPLCSYTPCGGKERKKPETLRLFRATIPPPNIDPTKVLGAALAQGPSPIILRCWDIVSVTTLKLHAGHYMSPEFISSQQSAHWCLVPTHPGARRVELRRVRSGPLQDMLRGRRVAG